MNFLDKFEICYSDPPWSYDFSETDSRKIENHYPTATVEEIISHKPNMEDNSVLFMWATVPKLLEALEVMKRVKKYQNLNWGENYQLKVKSKEE